jgi:hypothetical protein
MPIVSKFASFPATKRHKASRHSFWLWRPELRSASSLRLQHAQRKFLADVLIEAKLHVPALQEAWFDSNFGLLRTRDVRKDILGLIDD